ncbi:enoyl-CoA hydratase [Pseudidiomarina terrestris]|uniref:Enoyl-CoA hydratase n=1 Tax=Pseudidiomarina terrestris TaxID=2820060 RepID=A0AAW7QSX5_9GAMM|nr:MULTISPECIES: enoyl-CoA hydratase [unclassified Pseudidiomarina]MDN7123386.1 enoyl-CoA hydratase [Pseudidiomarina sp. 1APP75-32.1]MDN7128889.1 enoyl-CoA hydratase [Pseudidiomarina sp. 1APR75-15]MDN7134848.1 enoyl-CoA hydratase [Pseudidiomarina sp. 1ASP75-5]
MSDCIVTEKRDGIVWVTFNRPQKKNAITQQMYRDLTAALEDAERDSSVAAIVLQGSHGCFTAGNDLHDFLQADELNENSPPFEFLYTLSRLSVPVVASVDGPAIGIGTTILLHCDLVLAGNGAKLALPFIHLGLVPEAASSQLLPLLCGHLRAAELLLLGDSIDATTALSYGLVNKVVASEQLAEATAELAASLASKPVSGLRATKNLLKQPTEAVADRISREAQVFIKALHSDAAREAIAQKLHKKN